MHVPNSSIDKYYDGSLSFRRICEGTGVDRKSTTAGFLEKKKEMMLQDYKRSIDRSRGFVYVSPFFLPSFPFFFAGFLTILSFEHNSLEKENELINGKRYYLDRMKILL